MPFAPFDLTDNVVRANLQMLEKIHIIGNNLDFVVGIFPPRPKNDEADETQDDQLLQQKPKPTRASSVQAARQVADETVLWEADHYTWQSEISAQAASPTNESREAELLRHCLNCTLVTFPHADNSIDLQMSEYKPNLRSKL